MLIGVRESGGGLGNNADEIKTASILFDSITINYYRNEITDVMDRILEINDISLDLFFNTLQPLGIDGTTLSVQMSKIDDIINSGVDSMGDDWVLIDERNVDYENEEYLDAELLELNEEKQTTLKKIWKLVKTGIAKPNIKSLQDKTINEVMFKVRYQYNPLRVTRDKETGKNVSRAFCKKMVAAKKLYRKEDITRMSSTTVNAGWGLGGAANYDIFKYKGGGGCHHRWRRKTFMSKTKVDTKSPLAPTIGTRAAEIKGYTIRNPIEVSVRPVDMPKKGFVNK